MSYWREVFPLFFLKSIDRSTIPYNSHIRNSEETQTSPSRRKTKATQEESDKEDTEKEEDDANTEDDGDETQDETEDENEEEKAIPASTQKMEVAEHQVQQNHQGKF